MPTWSSCGKTNSSLDHGHDANRSVARSAHKTGRGPPKRASHQVLRGADDQIRTGDPNLGKVLPIVHLVLMRPSESIASGSSFALSGSVRPVSRALYYPSVHLCGEGNTAYAYTAHVALTDTSEAARKRQLDVFAAQPGADKVLLASEMAEQAKQIAFDGIRARNPELSEREVHESWLQMLHGELTPSLISKRDSETP